MHLSTIFQATQNGQASNEDVTSPILEDYDYGGGMMGYIKCTVRESGRI